MEILKIKEQIKKWEWILEIVDGPEENQLVITFDESITVSDYIDIDGMNLTIMEELSKDTLLVSLLLE